MDGRRVGAFGFSNGGFTVLVAVRRHVLTRRELEVLQLAANGATTEDIAQEVGLQPVTVRQAVQRISEKLGAKTRTHMACEAMRMMLIK